MRVQLSTLIIISIECHPNMGGYIMNIERLKPWNWFKHENDSINPVPISKSEAQPELRSRPFHVASAQQIRGGSLLQLHREMDRLFDDMWYSFAMPEAIQKDRLTSLIGSSPHTLVSNRVRVDIAGNEEGYEVSVELPGLSEDDIEIELNDTTLVVKGQKQESKETKDKRYYSVERCTGSVHRTLALPDDADIDSVSAVMNNGLLVINIPKNLKDQDKVKRIPISS